MYLNFQDLVGIPFTGVIANFPDGKLEEAQSRNPETREAKLKVMESITRRHFDNPESMQLQEALIRSVELNPDAFIARYVQHPESHGGRYVCADLFKETFDVYSHTKESRGRYNGLVHNSAAVLSSEQLRREITRTDAPYADRLILLSGVPGAGKTTSILVGGELERDVRAVFEGQLADVSSVIPKIELARQNGIFPFVQVVHVEPEVALRNTIKRFDKVGRGAGVEVMAKIQGGLPDGLAQLRARYGDDIALCVTDRRGGETQILRGWDYLDVLRSEGNREHIKERLVQGLEQLRADGAISEAAYKHAGGESVGIRKGGGSLGESPSRLAGGRDRTSSYPRQSAVLSEEVVMAALVRKGVPLEAATAFSRELVNKATILVSQRNTVPVPIVNPAPSPKV